MIRSILQTVSGVLHKIARFTASGRPGEKISDRELFQHYGFASRPKTGAEGIVIREGNHLVMVADDDRRYRIALESGEVALYTDEGDKVHLKRSGTIEITATAQVNVSAPVVRLGGLALETALGIVTGACSCSITGAVHPITSQTVKATL